MRRASYWLGLFVVALAVLVAAGFGLLQTRSGKDVLAAAISRVARGPNFALTVDGLSGLVPFQMTARRIALADADGAWLTLRDVRLEIVPADLFAGRLHVRLARAAEVDAVRPSTGPSKPLAEQLHVPRLPFALAVDRLVIDRLALAPAVLGASVVATVSGDVTVTGATAHAALDIHRIDASPGSVALRLTLSGTGPRLDLHLKASEPTGILLAQALHRTDRLPTTLSIDGDGPVSDWHGRLGAAAGPQARLDADLALAVTTETVLGLSAHADMAPLLPPDLAPLVGDNASLSLHATFGGRIVVDHLEFTTASGSIAGDAALGGPSRAVSGHLRADLPDLSKLAGIARGELHGSATLAAELSGDEIRPIVKADLTASGLGNARLSARRIEAHLAAAPTGNIDDPQTRIGIDAHGEVAGLMLPVANEFISHLGQTIDWSLAGAAARDARTVELTQFVVQAGGLDLKGSGRLAVAAGGATGFVNLSGAAKGLRTGIAAADALLGAAPALSATVRGDDAGIVSLDDLTLTGAAAKLVGNARFDATSNKLTAALSVDIPRLEKLRAAAGVDVAGSVGVKVKAQGALDRLQLQTEIVAQHIVAAGRSIDRAQVSGLVADLSQPKAVIDGSFRAGGLDGRLALTAAPIANTGLAVSNLRLSAADSAIAGDLRITFAGGLVEGSLSGRLPDLSRWSELAGRPLGGALDIAAGLGAASGRQGLDLTVNGARLAIGTAAIGRLTATARLADLWREPTGTGRLSASAVRLGALDFSAVTAAFDSRGPGRFAFQGSADGHPLSTTFAGEAGLVAGGASLRLARLTGSLGNEKFALDQPFDLSRRGNDLALSRLALRFGPGRITAGGSVRGEALAFTVDAANLPIAAGARLLGHPNVHGDLSVAATLGGSLRAPQGHLTLNAAGLALAASRQAATPRLGLTVDGDWNGRAVNLRGQVTGLHGDRMAFTGSLPLLLNPAPLGISLPPQGRLALRIEGGGDIAHLADLLPLGEDRLSGKFTADVSVGGTVAAPAASGRLQLSGARYQNFASGAALNNLNAELLGNGDRFQLASLSADDGAGGSLKAQGGLVLGGPGGPTAQLSATLTNFRVAARDEALATASGAVSVTGPLTALKVTAPLTVDHAEVNLPSSLPPSVVVIKVTEINGRVRPGPQPAQAAEASALSVILDITLRLSGTVVVQGHGLDSQWHGRLTITGTTDAPKISGTLVATRGSYALLGKTFRLTRGLITFDGSAKIDPALDIVAEANAADITAQVVVGGLASSPTVSLNSTPPLPRDEILARVLFGSGLRQMTPGQGIELAQAAATLAGGGPGMLDRLRGGLGLDWLRLGQGPAGAASSILNPSVVTPTTQGTTAVSAGKYIAPGVSIGVSQGVSPPTSKVTVEVDLGHHVTVDTEAGQNNGTGIGLNYNYDY
jgi:translocation and assembly module TamB